MSFEMIGTMYAAVLPEPVEAISMCHRLLPRQTLTGLRHRENIVALKNDRHGVLLNRSWLVVLRKRDVL